MKVNCIPIVCEEAFGETYMSMPTSDFAFDRLIQWARKELSRGIGIYCSYLELNISFTGTIQKNEAIQPTASTNETRGKSFRLQSCILLHVYRSI